LFYSSFVYTCVCVFLHIQSPLRECRSIRSGASGLPYYCTPLVCISVVIGLLIVWRLNKPKTKNHMQAVMWLPIRSYGKGTGIVNPITRTQQNPKPNYGNGKGTGNLPMEKKIATASPCKENMRIASESEKVFAIIFDELSRCSGLPKTSVF